jgi:hypothetical protein
VSTSKGGCESSESLMYFLIRLITSWGLCIPRNEPGFTPFAKASGRSGDQGEVSMV